MNDRIAKLKEMLEDEPNDPFCLYSLAQEYTKMGELNEAVTLYERTIEADPGYCYAYYHLAKVLEDQGSEDKARETLERGLERARAAGDEKALGEIAGYLDALS